MIKPHSWFETITPDTVAECWDGVYSFGNLYEQLWSCVEKYDEVDREDCGPADVVGINSVAQFWADFSPENQAKLNELAEAQDKALGGEEEYK
jgi:hypothetical protein